MVSPRPLARRVGIVSRLGQVEVDWGPPADSAIYNRQMPAIDNRFRKVTQRCETVADRLPARTHLENPNDIDQSKTGRPTARGAKPSGPPEP